MRSLVDDLGKRFDIVLIDSPPVLPEPYVPSGGWSPDGRDGPQRARQAERLPALVGVAWAAPALTFRCADSLLRHAKSSHQ
jgi:hypothetical protein